MSSFLGRLACVVLALSFISGLLGIARAEGEFVVSYDDPQDYPERPDVDLMSLDSSLVGQNVVIELKVYGNISSETGYDYYITSLCDILSTDSWFSFYFYEGNGTLTYIGQEDYVELNDTWTVAGNTLTVNVPARYAGSSSGFDLMATASYYSLSSTEVKTDNINFQDYSYGSMSYNFDNAEPLSVPGTAQGHLVNEESQVYSLELMADAGVLIVIKGDTGSWPSFTLFGAEHDYIASPFSMSGNENKMTFIPKTTGTYYLVVEGWSVSGDYKLTTSLRGQTGEGYERVEPDSVPWTVGEEWTAGGYFSAEDLIAQMFADSGGILYSPMMPHFKAEGGLADYLTVTYCGTEDGKYRFDYKCRLYCDISCEMTMTMTSEEQSGLYVTTTTSTSYMNDSIIADASYNGSIWLGYYENGDGDSYFGIEKQTFALSAVYNLYMDMSFTGAYIGMEPLDYGMEMSTWGNLSLDLEIENSPGMPFLPAQDKTLSVDKRVTTTYNGHISMDTHMIYNSTDIGYPDELGSDDMNYSEDNDFNGSYVAYYSLEYNSKNNMANVVPVITDPFTFMMLATSSSYSYTDGAPTENSNIFWLDCWASKATYDPEGGFYSSYEFPFSLLGGGNSLPLQASGESSLLSSLGAGTLNINVGIGETSLDEAQEFFTDPVGFLHEKEGGIFGAGSTQYILAGVMILFALLVAILVYGHRKIQRRQIP